MAEWVRASTGDRTVDGSSPTSVKKTLRFGTLAIPFTPLCQCLSDETVKAVGPFYLVSMPVEVKYPTSPHWNVQLSWTPAPPVTPLEVMKTLPCTEKEFTLCSFLCE